MARYNGVSGALVTLPAVVLASAQAAGQYTGLPSSEEAIPRGLVYVIQNYAQVDGLDGFGCGFADFNGDGSPDVVILGAADRHVGIWQNVGPGFFIDRSATSGIPPLAQFSGFAAADYDGDGDQDLYITRAGLPARLYRNGGNFAFTDVTAAAGVGNNGAGAGPCWGDYDGDGWLDLFVPNYNGAVPGTEFINDKLYRNNGNGTFTDVSVAQTVDDPGYGFQGVWFDYDLDGDVDLYLSNDRGHQPPLFEANKLWRNDNGQLVDVSVASGAGVALFSMGVACGDFDGNGSPDIYVTNLAGYAQGYNRLLLNLGNSTFFEASAPMGVDHWISSWGAIFYDFDNNGTQDLYVNNMFQPNTLYLGTPSPPCEDVGAGANVQGNNGVSYASAVADVDGDGDVDLLLNNMNNNVQLYINHEGTTRNWVRYRVVGLAPNHHAVGAYVRTRTGTTWRMREVLAGGNGFLGQNELTLHVGLNNAAVVDEVFARWPGGQPQRTLTGLPVNETWTIYPPQHLGDADGDGLVLVDDVAHFASCASSRFAPGCEMMDFDGDSDIDGADEASLLAAYDGSGADCDGNGAPDQAEIVLDPSLDLDATGILDSCEAIGDLNGDGSVGISDLLQLLASWGSCGTPCPADLDGSGAVGIADLLALLANWG